MMSRLSSARASLCLLFDLFFHLHNLKITNLWDSRNTLLFLRIAQDTSNCSSKQLAFLTELHLNAGEHTHARTKRRWRPVTGARGSSELCRHKSQAGAPSFFLAACSQTAFWRQEASDCSESTTKRRCTECCCLSARAAGPTFSSTSTLLVQWILHVFCSKDNVK